MQRYGGDNHREREPLGGGHDYDTPPKQAGRDGYNDHYAGAESPYYDVLSPLPQDPYKMQQPQQNYQSYQPYLEHDESSSGSHGYDHGAAVPPAPRHNDLTSWDGQGPDNFGEHPQNVGRLPPPPSRTMHPGPSVAGYNSGYTPETAYNRGPGQNQLPAQDSGSSLNPFGTPPAVRSPTRSLRSFGGESFGDDHYRGMPHNGNRYNDANLAFVNPNDIIDDGDDGLNYGRPSMRNSMLSLQHSDRGKSGAATATAGMGAAAAAGGVSSRSGLGGSDAQIAREKAENWVAPSKGRSRKWKWLVIILVFLLVAGAIVGGVIGSMNASNKKSTGDGSGGGGGLSAADDMNRNGDLNINSKDIKALLNNKNLHRVFPGMDYTPLNSQHPECILAPPSQNNITRDVAVLSQLTNKIRLYGNDCNQTRMVVHAVNQLQLQNDVKIWLGVHQDGNATTNTRQLNQLWEILDDYGATPFEGVIVGNELLFRKEMTVTALGTVLDGVRTELANRNMNLPVASSDLGDNWQAGLAAKSDYIMANIHPFFAGVAADQAASWTYSFWTGKDKQFWKSETSRNVISETGWPSAGGKHCGANPTCGPSEVGAVASIDNMNQFMNDWVCQALANGTNYFWFEAFDEPWKIRFNREGKEWEDKWGLMDVNRKLKSGIKIPDCGGQTV